MIHQKIEAFNDQAKLDPIGDNDQIVSMLLPLDTRNSIQLIGSKHVSLGAPSPSVTIAEVEQWRVNDVVFMDLRKKISKAFSNYVNENVRFNVDDEVCIRSQSHWDYLTFYLIDHTIQDAESKL
jgi:hypothetical protein